MHSAIINEVVSKLEEKLPDIVSRKIISQMTGGLYTTSSLANMDSLGLGPTEKFKIGKKVVYPKDSFLNWLRAQITE